MYDECWSKMYLLLGVILCLAQPSLADANTERRAVSVLLDRFETVIGTESNLLADSGKYDQIAESDARKLRIPFYLLSSGLNFLGPGSMQEIAKKSEFILVGATGFRPPKGLGPVRSKRCYVVVLSRDRPLELGKYFHLRPTASSDGRQVWSWYAKLGEFGEEDSRGTLLFATRITESYLIVSNDPQALQRVSNDLSLPDKPLEGLGSSPELDLVRGHRIWGYRRYRFSTSPGVDRDNQDLLNRASGMADVKPGTEALTFWIDPNSNRGVLRLVDPLTDPQTAAAINARDALPTLTPAGQGAWESTILLSGNEQTSEWLLGVMGMFGFGVYV